VIVMCNYCTVPNLDGVAPQTIPVDGAEGVVFITRDGLTGAAWTQLKRRVIRAIRAFRARRPTRLGGGGGDKDVADVRVHVGDDMILVKVEPGQVDDLKHSLSDANVDSGVNEAQGGVMPEFVEAVEEFVKDKGKAPDEGLSVLTASVLEEMSAASLPEAKEFAKEETRAVLEEVSKQIQSEVPNMLNAINSSTAVFAAAAKQFDMDENEAANEFKHQLEEATRDYVDVHASLDRIRVVIDGAPDSDKAVQVAKSELEHLPGSANYETDLARAEQEIREGIAEAVDMCPPCGEVDLAVTKQSAQNSGVRLDEFDADVDDEFTLTEHPLLGHITNATVAAAQAKVAWSDVAYVAAFLRGTAAARGPTTTLLIRRMQNQIDKVKLFTDDRRNSVQFFLKSVGELLNRNRVHQLPRTTLVSYVKTDGAASLEIRASAVKRKDGSVCLVVMDGDLTLGERANLFDVWAAAHEEQASLARYRMAHALFRAAQLRNDDADASVIRDKIINLQVDEIVKNIADTRDKFAQEAGKKHKGAEHSPAWIEHEGYSKCLAWFDDVLMATKAEATNKLTHRFTQVAALRTRAEEKWNNDATHKQSDKPTDTEMDIRGTKALAQALHDMQQRLSNVPDMSAFTDDVSKAVESLRASMAVVNPALKAIQEHVEWHTKTFRAGRSIEDSLALPCLARAAKQARDQIEKTATYALQKYADANAAFNEATKYLVLCTCAFDKTAQREKVALELTDSDPFAVAVHVDSTKQDVTLLLQYLSSEAATQFRPLMNHVDIATCAHLAALKPQLDEEQRFPRLVAVAAILQPELHNSEDGSLDKFLSTSKYGLDCGDAIAAPNLTGTGPADVHPKVVQLFAEAVKSDFENYCKPRQSQWNSYCESLSNARDALGIIVTDHRKGEPVLSVFASNACVGLLVDALDRTTKVTLPVCSPDDLVGDVVNAIKHGIPLRALASWVKSSLAKQNAALTNMVGQEPQGSLLPTTIHTVLKKAVEYTHPNINAVQFLLNVRDRTKDMCRINYDKNQVVYTVKAQAIKNKDLAERINKLLVLGDSVPDTIAKQTWREFWIAPVEAYDEWTKKPPLDAHVPAFFQHVFPDMSKNYSQQEKYDDLTKALKGAPPSMYMYAFTQARTWLATKQGTKFGGGARRRAHVPHPHFRVEPAAYASASARPEVLPALRSHDSITPAPFEAGGSGPATRSHNRRGAESHSLRNKPKSSLAGAVRRAVTLLVMEHKRISAAECCNRLLAGKFARATRREDTAVISAESDRAALCRLAKELCGPLCR
jgi:hypothetical protein